MPFFKFCGKCGEKKFHVARRSFLIKKVDRKPITTNEEICGRCYRKLKRIIRKV